MARSNRNSSSRASCSMLMYAFLVGLFLIDFGQATSDVSKNPTRIGSEKILKHEARNRKDDNNNEKKAGINRKTINEIFSSERNDNDADSERSLVVNGRHTRYTPYPRSMVFLSDRRDNLMCGGTLISPRLVLAAAHCEISLVTHATFYRNYHPHDRNEAAMERNSRVEIRIPIEQEIIHPEYSPTDLSHDIMLLVLEEAPNDITRSRTDEMIQEEIQYMKLHEPSMPSIDELVEFLHSEVSNSESESESDSDSGDVTSRWSSQQNYGEPVTTPLELKAFGWGHEWDGEDANGVTSTPADELMEVNLNYVTNDECRRQETSPTVSYSNKITDDMMCTWFDGQDTCHGDSGGPVLFEHPWYQEELEACPECEISRYVQVGVISWGEDCADEVFPGVASRVSEAFDWIKDRVCAIEGENAPVWYFCPEDHTYSPVPSMSPTEAIQKFIPKPRTMKVAIEIFLDQYAEETGWMLEELAPTQQRVYTVVYEDYDHENEVRHDFDLKNGATYWFKIIDRFGDGITNHGFYRIYYVNEDDKDNPVRQMIVEGEGDFGRNAEHTFTIFEVGEAPWLQIEPTSAPTSSPVDVVGRINSRERKRIGQLRGANTIP